MTAATAQTAAEGRGSAVYATQAQHDRWLRRVEALTLPARTERAARLRTLGVEVARMRMDDFARPDDDAANDVTDPQWYVDRALGALHTFDIVRACKDGQGSLGQIRKTCLDCGEVHDRGVHCTNRMLCANARGVYLNRNRARATKAWLRHVQNAPRKLTNGFLGRGVFGLKSLVLTLPQEGDQSPNYRVNVMADASAGFIQRLRSWLLFQAAVTFERARNAAWWRFYDETCDAMRSYSELVARYLADTREENEPPTREEYRALKQANGDFKKRAAAICKQRGYVAQWLTTLEIEPEKIAGRAVLTGFNHPHTNVLVIAPFIPTELRRKWWRAALAEQGFRAKVVNAPYIQSALRDPKTGATKTIAAAVGEALKYIVKDVVQPARDEDGNLPPLDETSEYGNLLDPRVFASIYIARLGKRTIRTSKGFWDVLLDDEDRPEKKSLKRAPKLEADDDFARGRGFDMGRPVRAGPGDIGPWRQIHQRPNKRHPSRCACGSIHVELAIRCSHPDPRHKKKRQRDVQRMHWIAFGQLQRERTAA